MYLWGPHDNSPHSFLDRSALLREWEVATTFLMSVCNSFKLHKCCEVHSAEEAGPGPQRWLASSSLNVQRHILAMHVA